MEKGMGSDSVHKSRVSVENREKERINRRFEGVTAKRKITFPRTI
jgi:hypothetical protein